MRDAAIVAGYRHALARRGQPVTFRRVSGQAPNVTTADAMVEAIVMNYQAAPSVMSSQPAATVTLDDRMVIVIESDLRRQQFPLPVRKNDKIEVNGEWLNVEALDPNKRALAGAIEIHAKGAK